jgi:hypothetical protein
MSSEQTTEIAPPHRHEGGDNHGPSTRAADPAGRLYGSAFAVAMVVSEIAWLGGIAYAAYRLIG